MKAIKILWYKSPLSAINIIFLCFFISNMSAGKILMENLPAKDKSTVITGELGNGFRYYIKPLHDENKIHTQLLVKAGFQEETPEQWECAHLIEHLLIKETENAPNGITAKLNEIGLGLRSVAAFTGRNNTSYNLEFPSEHKEALQVSMEFYHDVLSKQIFSPNAIADEKMRVIQEFNFRSGQKNIASHRLKAKAFPCFNEPPLDFEIHIKSLKKSTIQRYYNKWYQPGRTSLIIIGAIKDPADLEQQIRSMFSKITNESPRDGDMDCEQKYLKQSSKIVSVTSRLEEEKMHLELLHKLKKPTNMLAYYKDNYIETLGVNILNEHFKVFENQYGYSSKTWSRINEYPKAFAIAMVAAPGDFRRDLSQNMSLIAGLTQKEMNAYDFEKSKMRLLEQLKWVKNDNANYWLEMIRDRIIYGLKGNYLSKNELNEAVGGITKSDIDRFFKSVLQPAFDDITIIKPEKSDLDIEEGELRNSIYNAYKKPFIPEQTKVLHQLIPDSLNDSLKLHSIRKLKLSTDSLQEFELSNGIKLVFKTISSSKAENKIMVHGFTPIGANDFSPDDYESAINARDIIRNNGVYKYNKFQFNSYLDSIGFDGHLNPYIDNQTSGFRGEARVSDIELVFQLIYLYSQHARNTEEAFEDWKLNSSEFYSLGHNMGIADFADKIDVSIGRKTIPTGHMRIASVKNTVKEKAFHIYNQVFTNADRFTYIIVGDFEIEKVLPLAAKYLGNITSSSTNIMNAPFVKSSLLSTPKKIKVSIEGIQDVKMKLSYITPIYKEIWKAKIELDLMCRILNDVLVNSLWTDTSMGTTYFIAAAGRVDHLENYGELATYFDTDPNIAEGFRENVIKTISNLNIKEQRFQKNKEALLKRFDNEKLNVLMDDILGHYRYQEEFADYRTKQRYLNSISFTDFKKLYKEYLGKHPWEFIGINAHKRSPE